MMYIFDIRKKSFVSINCVLKIDFREKISQKWQQTAGTKLIIQPFSGKPKKSLGFLLYYLHIKETALTGRFGEGFWISWGVGPHEKPDKAFFGVCQVFVT